MERALETVSAHEFARDWGVTPQRVYQWLREGMPHEIVNKVKRIVPRDGNRWYVERLVAAAKKEKAPEPPRPKETELERKIRAEANLREFELAEKTRELVPATESADFCEMLFGAFSAVASGRLQRFERDIVNATDPAAARRLTQRVHTALMEGAQEYAAQLDAEAQAMDGPTPPEDPPAIAAA